MHNRTKDHCSPKYDVYRSGKGSPKQEYRQLLNSLLQYYREFQSYSRGNTVDTLVIPQILLPYHSLMSGV